MQEPSTQDIRAARSIDQKGLTPSLRRRSVLKKVKKDCSADEAAI